MALDPWLPIGTTIVAPQPAKKSGLPAVGKLLLLLPLTLILLQAALGSATSSLSWLFLLVCLGAIGKTAYRLAEPSLERRLWHPLEVQFEQYPLTLGSTTAFTLTRGSKKPLPDEANMTMHATLICREAIAREKDSGERHETKTQDVVHVPLPISGSVKDNTFIGNGTCEIPTDFGGPTLDLHPFSVTWYVQIDFGEFTKLFDGIRLPIQVAPELHRTKPTVQDAPPLLRPQDAS